jgi:apolipoprotein N-acyltransferase
LLLLAGLWPDLWFLSFLALVPFLHRVVRADSMQALRLGFLLGLFYFAVNLAGPLYTAPAQTLLRLGAGIALCAAFGWTVAVARRRWGFNPLLTALLWVAFEFILIRAGFAHGLLAELDVGTGFLYRSGILFGFLAISFIIVLINGILVQAIETVISLAKARGTVYPESERTWDPFLIPGLAAQRLYLAADNRAPPVFNPHQRV